MGGLRFRHPFKTKPRLVGALSFSVFVICTANSARLPQYCQRVLRFESRGQEQSGISAQRIPPGHHLAGDEETRPGGFGQFLQVLEFALQRLDMVEPG